MPTRVVGQCCCQSGPKIPVSFTFVTLNLQYQYSRSGSTWYTNCYKYGTPSVVIEVTYSDNTTAIIDISSWTVPQFVFVQSYASRDRHNDNQGSVTVDGLTAQWRVVFGGIPSDTWDYYATLNDATTVETYPFQ